MTEDIKRLSTHKDWETHWKDFKPGNIAFIRFEELIADLPHQGSFVEIGGFPGIYSTYFYKKLGLKPTLIDFVINKDLIHQVEKANGIDENTIDVVQHDFFTFEPDKEFDVVFSWGFIEHFTDIEEVMKRHTDLLAPGGKLLVGLPNLRGISGWFTRIVDKKAIDIHNLDCMDVNYLRQVCEKLPLKNLQVFYFDHSKIWINSSSPVNNKFMRTLVWMINMILRRIKVKNRIFSPHIVIKAEKV